MTCHFFPSASHDDGKVKSNVVISNLSNPGSGDGSDVDAGAGVELVVCVSTGRADVFAVTEGTCSDTAGL